MTSQTSGALDRFPWRPLAWGAAALILAAPAIAMQFTTEVSWTALDFGFMGAMLAAGLGGLEIALRSSRDFAYRLGAVVALGAGFLLVWVNAAVGVIADEQQSANLFYGAVLATALLGTLAVWGRAKGMVWTMIATAAVQVAVPLAVLMIWPDARPIVTEPEVPAATAVFVVLWLAAALLFRRSARAA